MQLEAYISELLYRYECVTIPEFGAFITQKVSASISEDTSTFYPPKKVLSFNEQIQKNDGLLALYIADVEEITFKVAVDKISKRVKLLKTYLAQGQTLNFANIGELSLSLEGRILFEPSYHVNYLTDAFGLSQFVSPNVVRETLKKEVKFVENLNTATLLKFEKRKERPYLKYAAVALVALTLGGFGMSNYYVNQIEEHNQIALDRANEQLENRIQEATFIVDSPLTAVKLNITKQVGKYHIIAGAFRIEENSTKKVEQLKALGYNATYIGENKYGLHEVVYSSYEDRIDALNALRQIRKEHNPEAWLLVKEL